MIGKEGETIKNAIKDNLITSFPPYITQHINEITDRGPCVPVHLCPVVPLSSFTLSLSNVNYLAIIPFFPIPFLCGTKQKIGRRGDAVGNDNGREEKKCSQLFVIYPLFVSSMLLLFVKWMGPCALFPF